MIDAGAQTLQRLSELLDQVRQRQGLKEKNSGCFIAKKSSAMSPDESFLSFVAISASMSQHKRQANIVKRPRLRQDKWVLVGLLALSMSIMTLAAPIESPVIQNSPTTTDAEAGAAPRSPMADRMSDKAYAASMTRDAQIVSRLLAHPNADYLATAALFSRLPSNDLGTESPLELIHRATLLAPTSPELAWLELSICRRLKCATAAQIETQMQTLDPDNGLLWVEDLGRSTAAGSEPEVTALVQRIGASSKFTFYFNRLMVMATNALAVGDPKLGLSERGILAIGMISATSIPPLQPISNACRVEELGQEGRRAACEALMSRLEQSSEILEQMLALSIEAHWWPANGPERAVLASKRRRFEYLIAESSRLRLFRMNHDMALRIEAARRYEREEDSALAVIKSFGSPTDPPAK
jgi:hypothetical protein